MRTLRRVAPILVAQLAVVSTAAAAPPHAGSRDRSFGGNGRIAFNLPGERMRPRAMVIQPDHRIVVAGTLTGSADRYPGTFMGRPLVVRFLPDGTLDPSFGTGGVARAELPMPVTIQGLALQPDGALILSGTAMRGDGFVDAAVARLLPSGEVDATFGSAGITTFHDDATFPGTVWSMSRVAVQPDGRIVVAGSQDAYDVHSTDDPLVARLMPNGELDSAFGGRGIARVGPQRPTSAVVRPDGDVVIAGVSDNYFGGTELGVLRIGGGPDPSPGSSSRSYHYVHTVTGATARALPDGSVVFIGNVSVDRVRTYLAVARFDAGLGLLERRLVPMFGLQAATFDERGAVLTAGPWGTGQDSPVFFVERYRSARRLDRSFGDADGQASIRIKTPANLIGMSMDGDSVVVAGYSRLRQFSDDEPLTMYRLHARQDAAGPQLSVTGLPRRGCLHEPRTLRVRARDESRTHTHVRLDGHTLATSKRKRFRTTIDPTTLDPGRHQLRIRSADAAGNLSAITRTIRICG